MENEKVYSSEPIGPQGLSGNSLLGKIEQCVTALRLKWLCSRKRWLFKEPGQKQIDKWFQSLNERQQKCALCGLTGVSQVICGACQSGK